MGIGIILCAQNQYYYGTCLEQRKIAYSDDNIFDWDSLESIGHEGECDEDVAGEAENQLFLNRLRNLLDLSSIDEYLADIDELPDD